MGENKKKIAGVKPSVVKEFEQKMLQNSAGNLQFNYSLASEVNISHHELIESITGGVPYMQGTCVRPQVAINLAQWLSPKFAVAVSKWVLDWISQINTLLEILQLKLILSY